MDVSQYVVDCLVGLCLLAPPAPPSSSGPPRPAPAPRPPSADTAGPPLPPTRPRAAMGENQPISSFAHLGSVFVIASLLLLPLPFPLSTLPLSLPVRPGPDGRARRRRRGCRARRQRQQRRAKRRRGGDHAAAGAGRGRDAGGRLCDERPRARGRHCPRKAGSRWGLWIAGRGGRWSVTREKRERGKKGKGRGEERSVRPLRETKAQEG